MTDELAVDLIACPKCGTSTGLEFIPRIIPGLVWMQCGCGYGQDIVPAKSEGRVN